MTYAPIPHAWTLFCVCFGLMLVAMFIMGRQSRHFYSVRRTVRRRFSIMDLEFPVSYEEQRMLVQGIDQLNDSNESKRAISALRWQLITDYLLYMPATYGGIFILCNSLSLRPDIGTLGHYFFATLALGQVLAFLLDAIENAVFLRIIAQRALPLKNTPADKKRYAGYHRWLQALEYIKFGLAMLGAVCGFSALSYYWLQGAYSGNDWIAVLVLPAEVMLYGFVNGLAAKSDKVKMLKARESWG